MTGPSNEEVVYEPAGSDRDTGHIVDLGNVDIRSTDKQISLGKKCDKCELDVCSSV